jgi:hypothetical protein
VEAVTTDIVTVTGAGTGNGTDGRISGNYGLVSVKRETGDHGQQPDPVPERDE